MIILQSKTKHGKEIIKKWGNKWERYSKGSLNNKILIISCLDKIGLGLPDSARWLDLSNDRDFAVEKILIEE